MINTRKTKVFKDKKWVDMQFKDLKINDIFQLFEEDGTQVFDDKGNSQWIVFNDVFMLDDGVYCARVDPINLIEEK